MNACRTLAGARLGGEAGPRAAGELSGRADLDGIERVRNGSGWMRVLAEKEASFRQVSADLMRLLLPVRGSSGNDGLFLGMGSNQKAIRIGAVAALPSRPAPGALTIDSTAKVDDKLMAD